MAGLETFFLMASLVGALLVPVLTVVVFLVGRRRPAAATGNTVVKGVPPSITRKSGVSITITTLTALTLVFVTLTIVFRAVQTGHGPFANMYEFALAFAWGVIVMGIVFQWRYKTGVIKNFGFVIALLLLVFAAVRSTRPEPLVPALQQSVLLSLHVASAVVAYGSLTIGFGAAVLFLVQNRRNSSWLPDSELLSTLSYQSVIIGFPFLTVLIILGALWADIAWGRYWSWDPKETASLVTWLLYAAYLHARVMRGWPGTRTSIILIVGFLAILLTFFGNYLFLGLHSYR